MEQKKYKEYIHTLKKMKYPQKISVTKKTKEKIWQRKVINHNISCSNFSCKYITYFT